MPTVTIVYGAKQMPSETKKELNSDLVDEQRNFWMQPLQDKRKHIDNAKKYVGPQVLYPLEGGRAKSILITSHG